MSWADGRKRCVVKRVTFTSDEWSAAESLWHSVRDLDGRLNTFSAHAREMLICGSVNQLVVPADTDSLNYEFVKIGVNINQIAHKVNSSKTVTQADWERVMNNLNRAEFLLKNLTEQFLQTASQTGEQRWQ